jgi:hypothetical protein
MADATMKAMTRGSEGMEAFGHGGVKLDLGDFKSVA